MVTFSTSAMRLAAVCLVLLSFAARAEAVSVTVAWNPNTEPDIAGYRVMYGTQSGVYTTTVSVGNQTSVTLPSLAPAVYFFVVRAVNAGGVSSLNSVELRADLTVPPPPPNFLDADGKADIAVWRPSNGTWYSLRSSTGFNAASGGSLQWGNESLGDKPFMGDVDGDGSTDMIVWRASTGTWYWLTSSTGFNPAAAGTRQWGSSALGDVPMVADLDGDKKVELIVWRPTDGTWYWLRSTNSYSYTGYGIRQWGNKGLGDQPLVADLDADAKGDLVVWRASTGTWYWLSSSTGYSPMAAGGIQWGNSGLGDKPMLADLDGDGRADLTVWRPTDGTWYWLKSASGYSYVGYGAKQWGSQAAGDVPLAGDMDGDGKADLVVWRSSTATWYWLTSLTGYNYAAAGSKQFGAPGDVPKIK